MKSRGHSSRITDPERRSSVGNDGVLAGSMQRRVGQHLDEAAFRKVGFAQRRKHGNVPQFRDRYLVHGGGAVTGDPHRTVYPYRLAPRPKFLDRPRTR